MRKLALLVPLLSTGLLAGSALATVNHGTFVGVDVDFVDVSETTTSAGDAEPLWDAPTLNPLADGLQFFPPNFTSSCAAGGSDVTSSDLTTRVEAKGLATIDTVALTENGDAVMTSFPPFGTPDTNATAALTGTITVLEDTGGPITVPVVIPFSGSFAPSDTFELPTNFGTSLWSGSVLVDVAAVVPNAKVAEVTLTNTLTSDCGAGNTSSKIQKKVVQGPVASITINPIECDVDLEKTCCVTQPALPELGQCEGDMVSMTLEYTGDRCHASNNDQGRAFRCHGRRRVGEPADITILRHSSEVSASPDTDVEIGDEVTFSSTTGTLYPKTKIKVRGSWWRRQYLKIDTSCERAFQCGDQFGAFEVTGFESTLGGEVLCDAPPPPPVCAVDGDPEDTPCDAKVIDLVLEYNGQDCQDPLENPQSGEASCSGDATGAVNVGIKNAGKLRYRQQIAPSSNINDGDRIRITSTHRSGFHPNQKLLVVDANGVVQVVEFHTSCSQDLALGDEFGSFKVVEFTTKSGNTFALGDGSGGDGTSDACEVPLAPPGPHCTDHLEDITLVYIGDFLGEGCTVSNPQGGYAYCSGVDEPASDGTTVSVSVPGYDVEPETDIEFGDLITISKSDGSDLGIVMVDTTGDQGSQWVQIKANCYKPLSLGDRFGSWVVFGMTREEDGPITLGGNVQYQYTVTNPSGTDTVENVTIDDDQLGNIVSGLSLAPGESQTFVSPATLYGTTTNVATANGDVMGAFCAPGQDQVTVDVLAPPQGSFSCTEPITELSMTWNGTQTVDVRAWSGQPGTSTDLGYFDDVAPGETITVSGLGSSYPYWEIFAQAGFPKLGESSFDLWCNDWHMNGLEDCGKAQGNRKHDFPSLINDWLLEGMVDDDETLSCTPGTVASPPDCGFGPELLVVLPGLMWIHRRRMRKA